MELSSASLLKLGSFLSWSWLYMWCSVSSPAQTPEWASRVVTLLHGSVATVIGLLQCGITTVSKCRLTEKIMPHHYALMVWSWGYFAFDLLWCLLYWREHSLMLCHHASALAAITLYMQKNYSGCVFPCTLALMEVTNPLLQTRWFLKNTGYDKTILFYIVEVTYVLLFLSLRGVFGTYLMFKIMETDIFDLEEKLISLVFYLVSVAFIYEIVGYVLYKYKTKIGKFRGFLEEFVKVLNEHCYGNNLNFIKILI